MELTTALRAIEEALMLRLIDRRLARLTWGEVTRPGDGPWPSARVTGRRQNRFATLRPERGAGTTGLARATRLYALTRLREEVQSLTREVTETGALTVGALTRAGRLFGTTPGTLGARLVAAARPPGRRPKPSAARSRRRRRGWRGRCVPRGAPRSLSRG